MKSNGGFSVFRGLARLKKAERDDAGAKTGLSGASLENAYRDLLLENQMLTESNQRLHDRLARAEAGLGESPAAKQLIQAQRSALVERTHKLRELQYANKTLERERDKLRRHARHLKAKLEHATQATAPLAKQLDAKQREVETVTEQLADKRRKLAMLTDRYYQLQSQVDPKLSADRVINADF